MKKWKILDNPRQSKKIKLNFYFHTSLWCLKRFYEGLKAFISIQLSEINKSSRVNWLLILNHNKFYSFYQATSWKGKIPLQIITKASAKVSSIHSNISHICLDLYRDIISFKSISNKPVAKYLLNIPMNQFYMDKLNLISNQFNIKRLTL